MATILLDNNAPKRLRTELPGHNVETAFERGWASLTNGDLIAAAEAAGFDVLVTADKNLEYQQKIATRRLAVVVLDDNRWSRVRQNVDRISESVGLALAGRFIRVSFPSSPSRDSGGPKL
jgi:predicted nuclease of predicted toxin-antitoxin system